MTILDAKKEFLERLYHIHDTFCAGSGAYACRKGCDTCCTANVTMTTLEGIRLLEHLETAGRNKALAALDAQAGGSRFRPLVTINQLAGLCMRDEEVPEETVDPRSGSCPLVTDRMCPGYDARPFGCRSMLSRTTCDPAGEADMPGAVMAVNTVLAQYLEAVDQPGFTGNLLDVLSYLRNPIHRQCYQDQQVISKPNLLLANQPLPVLMVPPEYREHTQSVIRQVQQTIAELFGRPA